MADAGKLAILGYHKVGKAETDAWGTWNYVSAGTFERQLRTLSDLGWEIIDVERFLSGLLGVDALPTRCVLLTFDDGYRCILEDAVPVLRRLGHPAIAFIPTAYVGGTNRFDEGNQPEEAICDWAELEALHAAGVSVQSHGVNHQPFSDLTTTEIERELHDSREVLENALGPGVEMFAFPYGDGGIDGVEMPRLMESAGYKCACLYPGGVVSLPIQNPFRLTRIAMGPDTDLSRVLSE